IVVEAPLETRLDRLEARGGPRDDARRRIGLQATDADRRKVATWVVDNAGDLAHLEHQITDIWAELERRAAATYLSHPAGTLAPCPISSSSPTSRPQAIS